KEVISRVPADWWEQWLNKLRTLPPSFRKLEWNCKGEKRDLWKHILQLRPSGLRVKRYENSPALIAMTSTQIPIIGPRGRFLTRREGLRLQNLPDHHELPKTRVASFKALGNGVHAGVVEAIARTWLPKAEPELVVVDPESVA
ncbi:MAG TPA: DNA cytosine methyltransferase, partial [Myxococcales bacterium]|nr:DNA cytosine methyltransferase [Myxococcales bacterium]